MGKSSLCCPANFDPGNESHALWQAYGQSQEYQLWNTMALGIVASPQSKLALVTKFYH